MGKLSQIVSFFSDFPPISYEFHTFFRHFPLGVFGTFSYFPISPHFPPFFHCPHFPLRLVGYFGCGYRPRLV